MAYFAELDENNIVLRVIAVSNEDIKENGVEKESKGKKFCEDLLGAGRIWVQTSYNAKTNGKRKKYAGIGDTYDSIKDKFILPQPYPSWMLDNKDGWQPPVAMPDIVGDERYTWNEGALTWDLVE